MADSALLAWLRAAVRHPLALMIAGLVVTFAASQAIGGVALATGYSESTPPGWQMLVRLISITAFLGIYYLFVTRVEGRKASELSLSGAPREAAIGIALGMGGIAMSIGVIALCGGYHVSGVNPATAMIAPLATAMITAVYEEALFRGILFRQIEQWLGSWAALALTAALFGAAHLANPNATALAGFAIAMEAGVLLGALYMLTRRLWAVIGLHAAWNFTLGGIFGLPVSGYAGAGLLASSISGPEWLTGGAFGAEAALPTMVIYSAIGMVCLWLAHRRGQWIAPSWQRFRTGMESGAEAPPTR